MQAIANACLKVESVLNWADYIPIVSNFSGFARLGLVTAQGSGLPVAAFFGVRGLVAEIVGKTTLAAKYYNRALFCIHVWGNGWLNGGRAVVVQFPVVGNIACAIWDYTRKGAQLIPYMPKAAVEFSELATHVVPR